MKNSLTSFDTEHIWHPYSSITNPICPLLVESASGVFINLNDGTKLIDAMASWWSVIHGYNHPIITLEAKNQLDKMSHVMFGGLTHEPAINLCKQLISMTPPSLKKVFLSDSGSVAVDVAMKMALQYWQSNGLSNKTKFVALRGGYHGDTLGAMSVCDPDTGMHHLFKELIAKQIFIGKPLAKYGEKASQVEIDQIEKLFQSKKDTIAAVILEPILQGAGGMYFYSVDFLKNLRDLCEKYNILLIADEIATGFGRTGELFASNHADIEPDIMCLGKAMTGGYLSLAATLTNEKIAEGICNSAEKVFMHGPTFMANPLACKISETSINLLLANDWKSNVKRIETQLKKNLTPYKIHSKINDIRILGAVGVIEAKENVDMQKVQNLLPKSGVWLRPFGKLIYTMPPYIIQNNEIDKITSVMIDIVEECT